MIFSANFAMRTSSGGSFRYSSMPAGGVFARQTKFVAVDLGQLRLGFVAIDGVVGIEVVDRAPGVRTHLPEISREALRALRQEKDVGSQRLHQDAITNGSARDRRCFARIHQRRQPIASIARRSQLGLLSTNLTRLCRQNR